MNTTLPTSKVLNLAADLIEERGWTKGTGWPVAGEPEDAPLCLEGGIMAALGLRMSTFTSFGPDLRDTFEDCPAYQAVERYLDTETMLWSWNDRSGRTAEQVIATLRAFGNYGVAAFNAFAALFVLVAIAIDRRL